jgi:hypothetical protein
LFLVLFSLSSISIQFIIVFGNHFICHSLDMPFQHNHFSSVIYIIYGLYSSLLISLIHLFLTLCITGILANLLRMYVSVASSICISFSSFCHTSNPYVTVILIIV